MQATDLRNSIIFLHGLSGSGKGEAAKRLQTRYKENGYTPIYTTSGGLFRAALDDPKLSEQVKSGKFADTLYPIFPGLQKIFSHFIKTWVETDGKAVLILDGLIRREEYIKEDGIRIPSQIDQLADALNTVLTELTVENEAVRRAFPDYNTVDLAQTLRDSVHMVIDVKPEDAEAQMIRRAAKELVKIRIATQNPALQRKIESSKRKSLEKNTFKLDALLHGGFVAGSRSVMYINNPLRWPNTVPAELYSVVNREVKKISVEVARIAEADENTNLSQSLERIGIHTEIREDDISASGRKRRIENYVRKAADGYQPGFATLALTHDLAIRFDPQGYFVSTGENCVVIPNGQSRGIDFETFQGKCDEIAVRRYNQTEKDRGRIFTNKEGGHRGGKERQ